MNNKEQQPEPLAAILAEMRGNEFDDPHLDADGIIGARRLARDWADRIEAAARKDRAMLDANIARVRKLEGMLGNAADALLGCAIRQRQSVPANSAAIRTALKKIEGLAHCDLADVYPARREKFDRMIGGIESAARAALAAPPRNCDRPECATAEGAIAALRANPCADHDFCKEQLDCAECATRWLIAPAKEGGEK